jgi:putative MATE family efflux protein
MFGAQDMTVGSPLSSMLKFSVPLLIGNIAQLLYNTVDSIVVGQYSGMNGLSAIGASMSIQFMFAVFFMTVGTGVSVMVSQFFGAKDKERLSNTVGQSMILVLIATLLSTVLGFALAKWILTITKCPIEVLPHAIAYLRIMFLGFVGMGFYNILGGILRGLGDSMFPMLVLFGTTILNIVLDIWFVAPPDKLWGIGLNLGVAGAAWATIIAQTLSALVCLWRLLQLKDIVSVTRKTMKLTKEISFQIFRIGIPSGLQQMIMSMSFVFVQSLINSVIIPFNGILVVENAIFVAVNTAVMRIDGFAMMPAQTFNQVASTFTGQNIGANKLDRVNKGVRICLTMAVSVSLAVVIIILIWGKGLMQMFINEDVVKDEVISSVIVELYAETGKLPAENDVLLLTKTVLAGKDPATALEDTSIITEEAVTAANNLIAQEDLVALKTKLLADKDVFALLDKVIQNEEVIELANKLIATDGFIAKDDVIRTTAEVSALTAQLSENEDFIALTNAIVTIALPDATSSDDGLTALTHTITEIMVTQKIAKIALTAKIIEVGVKMQRIMVIGYIIMAVANTIGGVMRGAGDTMAQLYIMVATNIVIRIPLTVLMMRLSVTPEYPNGAPEMIFWSMLIAFGLNVLCTCIYFAKGNWKTKSVVKRGADSGVTH